MRLVQPPYESPDGGVVLCGTSPRSLASQRGMTSTPRSPGFWTVVPGNARSASSRNGRPSETQTSTAPASAVTRTSASVVAVLLRLGAADLAAELWRVANLGELPRDTGEVILDVIGQEAANRGLDRDGKPNRLGRELDELGDWLWLDE